MDSSFFNRDACTVARDLLGCELVRVIGKETRRGIIIETEAYKGLKDKASHASRGRTRRTEPMFGPPGTLYVYLIYGMHYCLNFVTGKAGSPSAVLIRGVVLSDGTKLNGPGKVARYFKITTFFSGKNLFVSKKITIRKKHAKPKNIIRTPRIGVDYAGEWSRKPWRFLVK